MTDPQCTRCGGRGFVRESGRYLWCPDCSHLDGALERTWIRSESDAQQFPAERTVGRRRMVLWYTVEHPAAGHTYVWASSDGRFYAAPSTWLWPVQAAQ